MNKIEQALRDALYAAREFVVSYYDYQHPEGNEATLAQVDAALALRSPTALSPEGVAAKGLSELDLLGTTDCTKWAAEFSRIATGLGHNIDEGWMQTWFANAIETGRGHPHTTARSGPWEECSTCGDMVAIATNSPPAAAQDAEDDLADYKRECIREHEEGKEGSAFSLAGSQAVLRLIESRLMAIFCDAQRYQWLRSRKANTQIDVVLDLDGWEWEGTPLRESELDAAVDAARKEAGNG